MGSQLSSITGKGLRGGGGVCMCVGGVGGPRGGQGEGGAGSLQLLPGRRAPQAYQRGSPKTRTAAPCCRCSSETGSHTTGHAAASLGLSSQSCRRCAEPQHFGGWEGRVQASLCPLSWPALPAKPSLEAGQVPLQPVQPQLVKGREAARRGRVAAQSRRRPGRAIAQSGCLLQGAGRLGAPGLCNKPSQT